MNGYALANGFRQLRESWRFTSIEADLYYELVAIANQRSWPTSYQYSNQLLCATLGISEKSLIAARNRLKQAGLLEFVSGHKRAPTAYELRQIGLPEVSKSSSKKGSVSGSESDSPFIKELKQKEIELQKKIEQEQAAGAAARAEFEAALAKAGLEIESLKAQRLASHTEGGAADVGTPKPVARPHAYDPTAIAENLRLPFASTDFRANWVKWRTYREEQRYRRLSGGMMEQTMLDKLALLAAGSEAAALALIDQAIAKGWQDFYPLDKPRQQESTTANPQRHAVTSRNNASYGAAARAQFVPDVTDYGSLD